MTTRLLGTLRRAALVTLGSLVLAPTALADTWTVDNDPDPDCDTPDAISIQQAVGLAEPGDTIQVCPGTYPESVLVPAPKSELRIKAKGPEGAVRVAGGAGAFGFQLAGTTGVLLEGFTVSGYGNDIRLNGASGNVIRHNVTTAATDHAGIFIDADSSDNLVEHNESFGNRGPRGTGIRIAGRNLPGRPPQPPARSADNVVRDNSVHGNSCIGIFSGGGMQFESPGPPGRDNEITHNRVFLNGGAAPTGQPLCAAAGSNGTGVNIAFSSDTLVAHNDVYRNERVGILVGGTRAARNVVEHNRTYENGLAAFDPPETGGDGIRVNDPQGVDLLCPRLPLPREVCGDPTRNVVRYNESFRNGRVGIRVALAKGTVVEHNVVDENGVFDENGVPTRPGIGIELGAARETTVRNNVSRDHARAGYALRGGINTFAPTPTLDTDFEDNVAKSNGGDGVVLESADGNTLVRNRSDNNGGDGIRVMLGSIGNDLLANTMFSNLVDAEDENRPANTWERNRCRTDLPSGTICENGPEE